MYDEKNSWMRKGREMQERKGFLIISRTEAKSERGRGEGKASSNYRTSHPLTPPPPFQNHHV